MKQAFIFPGQGSQFVAMGKEFAENFLVAKEVFQEVDEALGENLTKKIFEGPLEELTQTENTQPALMAVSLAIVRTLEQEFNILVKNCSYVAGHSLGEYSALAASNALTVGDAAKLLRIRGNAMKNAVPEVKCAMAAIMADYELCKELVLNAAKEQVCEIANYNSFEQIVISGHEEAIDRAIALAAAKQKRAIKLNVSAPFHCSLMHKAAAIMEEALIDFKMQAPVVPIITNVNCDITQDPKIIKSLLIKQVTGTVRWFETILLLKQKGINTIVEIGAGKVLTNLNKRIDKEIESFSIQTPKDIEQLLLKNKA